MQVPSAYRIKEKKKGQTMIFINEPSEEQTETDWK